MTAAPHSHPLLQMKGIVKEFPGVKALDGVDLRLRAGEVHALMGENGAGKSTLIKVLTGAHPATKGEIRLGGSRIEPKSPLEAQRLGISTVYQEVNLVPSLSVAENLFLGRQPKLLGFIDWKRMRADSVKAMKRLELELDVMRPVGSYSIAIQQMVAIARALDVSARLLILDEPTSSLDADEVKRLFTVIRGLKQAGLGILLVTHFMDQVYAISDRITVLRNGKLVGEYETEALPRAELIGKMMGKELAEFEFQHGEARVTDSARGIAAAGDSTAKTATQTATKTTMMRITGASRRGSMEAFDLEVNSSQVLGLAGLLGSGRSEVARLLFGVDRAESGKIELDAKPLRLRSPRDAVKAGLALCPEDRKTQGIIPDLSIRENIVLAVQARQGWARPIPRKKQDELARHYMQALGIVASSPEQPIRTLSGGNQQKVILARWLASKPRLLILDEPTRGIDVGAKAEIQKLMLSLCDDGMGIVFISSELEELVRCSQRVAVLRDRKKIRELQGTEINEKAVMTAIAEAPTGGGTA